MFEFEGNVYDGDFVDGMFHGKGHYKFAEKGKSYTGSFYDNQMHGQGLMKFADGGIYKGEFVEGKMHGYGERTYENGDKYTGTFKADKRHGNGIFYEAKERKKRDSVWENDYEMPPEMMGDSPWKNMRGNVHTKDHFNDKMNIKRPKVKAAQRGGAHMEQYSQYEEEVGMFDSASQGPNPQMKRGGRTSLGNSAYKA